MIKMMQKKNQKGLALYLTLIMLMVLAAAVFGFHGIYRLQRRAKEQEWNSTRAYYLARTGIARACRELKTNHWWAASKAFDFKYPVEVNGGGGYSVSVWAPVTNLKSSRKVWKVTSTGRFAGARRTLTAWMETQSFARYAYFTNSETWDGQPLWFTDTDRITGRIHTNGYFSFYRHPRIAGIVTSHNGADPLFDRQKLIYQQGGKKYYKPSYFYHYFSGYGKDEPVSSTPNEGGFSFQGAQSAVSLPRDTSSLRINADRFYTGEVKVKFLDTGKVKVTYKETGNEKEPGERMEPYDTREDGEKTRSEELDAENLTIFIDGKGIIEGGVFQGSCTVASSGDIEIQDGVYYREPGNEILGLVAENDVVIKTDPYRQKDLNLDMIILALNGSFRVDEYDKGEPRGTLIVRGGVIQNRRGPAAARVPDSMGIRSGYYKNYIYDPSLIHRPPPNFPCTDRIIILSMQDKDSF